MTVPQALQDLRLTLIASASTTTWCDFGVTLASFWHVLAINANMVRPRLSNGRALTSARQPKANQRPSSGWDSAGVRAGERWISHLPPVCAEQALGQRPLRKDSEGWRR
jgi:hypothetical protein